MVGRKTVKHGRSGHSSASRLRRVEAWLVVPIAIVIGLIAFTDVGASAPATPSQTAPKAQLGTPGLSATNLGSAAAVGAAKVYHPPASDPRFDLAAAPASTQYCPHALHPPPCGKKGGGHGQGNGGGQGQGNGGGHGEGNGGQVTGPAATGATDAGSGTTAGGLPFTGEDVLLVILVGLLLTTAGLELAARTRVRTA